MKRCIKADSGKFGSENQVKFFYKGKFLGSCDSDYIECPELLNLMESDKEVATSILNYLNSLGDPVFPVSEEKWSTPETNVDNVDITDLYNTFMQELDYEYRDSETMGFGFYVGGDYLLPDFEIFDGPTVDDVESSTKIKASRYDNVPGYKAPEGGYLYIFKHGIGPGTLPSDVEIIQTKDLPNGYTAVWLGDFLTTDELKKYDIPDETRINELLGRIGYCQKNGDVVPCDDVEACGNINGVTEPNSPDADKTKLVRQVIKQAKEIREYFQSHNNNLNRKQEQYLEDLSDGIDNESVAAIRGAVENMKYNSKNLRSEQYNLIMDLYDEFNLAGGKFEGMGYPEDAGIDACSSVTASTNDSSIVDKIYSVMMDYEYGYAPDMTDINAMLQELTNRGVHVDTSETFKNAWVSAHNKAERKTWGGSGDAYHYDSLTPKELEDIENYDTEYWEYVKDHPLNLKPASVTSSTDTKYLANMISASDDGADESEWYDWWNDVDGYLMGWDKEFKQLIYDFRKENGWPKDFKDPLCDKLADVVYGYVRTHLDELDIDPNENNDSDYREFADERMLDWLLEEPAAYDFWADYKG